MKRGEKMNKKIKFVLIIFIIIVVMLLGIIFFRYNILKDILTRYNKSISDINYLKNQKFIQQMQVELMKLL